MNVKELIKALSALPKSTHKLEVVTEGCDCMGDVAKVEVVNDLYRPINFPPLKNSDRVMLWRAKEKRGGGGG